MVCTYCNSNLFIKHKPPYSHICINCHTKHLFNNKNEVLKSKVSNPFLKLRLINLFLLISIAIYSYFHSAFSTAFLFLISINFLISVIEASKYGVISLQNVLFTYKNQQPVTFMTLYIVNVLLCLGTISLSIFLLINDHF